MTSAATGQRQMSGSTCFCDEVAPQHDHLQLMECASISQSGWTGVLIHHALCLMQSHPPVVDTGVGNNSIWFCCRGFGDDQVQHPWPLLQGTTIQHIPPPLRTAEVEEAVGLHTQMLSLFQLTYLCPDSVVRGSVRVGLVVADVLIKQRPSFAGPRHLADFQCYCCFADQSPDEATCSLCAQRQVLCCLLRNRE